MKKKVIEPKKVEQPKPIYPAFYKPGRPLGGYDGRQNGGDTARDK